MSNRLIEAVERFWRSLFPKPRLTLKQEIAKFLGPNFLQLQTHDKHFPGYDLASVNLALHSFFEDCCARINTLGGCCAINMRGLYDMFIYNPNLMVNASPHQRVPTDVEEEASFATNQLTLCLVLPSAGKNKEPAAARIGGSKNGQPTDEANEEKIVVLLATVTHQHDYWDGMDTRHAPGQFVCVSVACQRKELADRFFTEVEERRKRLSIYRGKVIDPVVGPGGVHTIGFRALQKVQEQDLILPQALRALLHSSILNFYNHREVLQGLGIDLKRGILFHGPPGTGKTSISLYLANLLPNFTVCFVSGERLLYPRELCRMARYLQPAMIVFEDIDLVAQERQANGLATVLGELMNQIDGCEPTEQVLFIMNTNSLERLEHAVKNRPGRVDQIIQVPLPDREERQRLLEHFTRQVVVEGEIDRVLRVTEGATPAMLKEIVKRAVVSVLSRGPEQGFIPTASSKDGQISVSADSQGEKRDNSKPINLRDDDLILATEQVRAMRDPEIVPGSFGFRDKSFT